MKVHNAATLIGAIGILVASINGSLLTAMVGCTFLICGELGAIAEAIEDKP